MKLNSANQYLILIKELRKQGPATLSLDVPRAFVSGRNVRLLWTLSKNHPDLDKIMSFQIELRVENSGKEWITGDLVDGHVRAVTIKALLPRNRLVQVVMILYIAVLQIC